MGNKLLFCMVVLIFGSLGCMDSEQEARPTPITNPLTVTSGPPEINTDDARSLFEIKCSSCHSLDRPASKKKNYDEWLSTTHRMIDYGATVTDEEAEVIATYLAQVYGKELS